MKNLFKAIAFMGAIFAIALVLTGCSDNDGASNGTGSKDERFITTWDTSLRSWSHTGFYSSESNQIKLPLDQNGTYDFEVEWGDGSTDNITSYDQPEITHTYSAEGIYDVKITGKIEGFGLYYYTREGEKLLDVKNWGDVKLHNNGYQFFDTMNLTGFSASDLPDLTNITNMSGMFYGSSFNQDIGSWDVSNVTNMSDMFNLSDFNADISSWDVSSVTDMKEMFCTSAFNQDISSWDVSSVTDMSEMFVGSGLEGNEPSWYVP